MIKEFISFGTSEIYSRALNWLLLFILPFYLSSEIYGEITIYVVLVQLLSSVILLGQNKVILRYSASLSNQKSFIPTVFTIWLCTISIFILIAVFYFIFSPTDIIFGIEFDYWKYSILIACIIYMGFRQLFLSRLVAITDSRKYFFDQIYFSTLKFFFIFSLLYVFSKAEYYLIGLLTVGILFFSIEFRNFINDNYFNISYKLLKRNFIFGIPFIFHIVGGNILSYFDRFLVEHYLNLSSVGIYSFIYNIGAGISFIFAPLVLFFEPRVYKHVNDSSKSEEWLTLFFLSSISLFCFASALVLFFVPSLIHTFVDESYSKNLYILPIIIAAMMNTALYLEGNFRLTLAEKPKYLPAITLSAGITNVFLNFILIPKFGLHGAAFSTLISMIFQSIFIQYVSIKYSFVNTKRTNIVGVLKIITIISSIIIAFTTSTNNAAGILLLLALISAGYYFLKIK